MKLIKLLSLAGAILLFPFLCYLTWGAIYSLFDNPGLGAKIVTTVGALIISVIAAQISFAVLMAMLIMFLFSYELASPYIFKAKWWVEYRLHGIENEDDYVAIMDLKHGIHMWQLSRILPDARKAAAVPLVCRQYGKMVKTTGNDLNVQWVFVHKKDADVFMKALLDIQKQTLARAY